MITSTTKDRKVRKPFTPEHAEKIRQAAKKRRQDAQLAMNIEVRFGENCQPKEQCDTLKSKLKYFLTQSNCDIMWANYKGRQYEAGTLTRMLARRLSRSFNGQTESVTAFLADYILHVAELDRQHPFPINEHLTVWNYTERREFLEKLKEDALEKLIAMIGE